MAHACAHDSSHGRPPAARAFCGGQAEGEQPERVGRVVGDQKADRATVLCSDVHRVRDLEPAEFRQCENADTVPPIGRWEGHRGTFGRGAAALSARFGLSPDRTSSRRKRHI